MLESSALSALTATAIAGLSTMLGILPIFFKRLKTQKALILSLAFAAGIMLSVSFTDLWASGFELILTEASNAVAVLLGSASFALGISLTALITTLLPEAENNPSHIGLVSALCIGLHNFPEGIATFMATYNDPRLGLCVALAIAMHNIPEGLGVALPLYCAGETKGKAIFYTFISGVAEPVGALTAFLLLRPIISNILLGCILSSVAGIMIYIAVKELLPMVAREKCRGAYPMVFLGIVLMMLVKAI